MQLHDRPDSGEKQEVALNTTMLDTPVEALRETLEETMERLMSHHGDSLTRLCFMMLSARMLAEDAVQETFLRAYKAYPRFRHDSSEYTWLTRIAINCCHTIRARAWFRLEDRNKNPEDIPPACREDWLPDDTVIQAIMRLKPKYKDPILLFYYQGFSTKEIAKTLSLPVSTVSVRLLRARNMLKEELKEWYFDE